MYKPTHHEVEVAKRYARMSLHAEEKYYKRWGAACGWLWAVENYPEVRLTLREAVLRIPL